MTQPAGDYDCTGDEVWTPSLQGSFGAAHSISSDVESDVLSDLYAAVFDATGRDMRPQKQKIGFL